VLRLSLVAFLYCATAAAQPAPFTVYSEPTELDGHTVEVDIYRLVDKPTDGIAIVAHGFARSRARHRDLGRALAAAGITAVIPDLPHVVDHWGNGDAVVELAHRLEAGEFGLPPVQRSRLVLIGTSAGGLSTVLAAARLPGLAGWIGLDPVDRTGTGMRAAAQLGAPAVVLLAERSGCNLYGSGRSIAEAVPVLLRSTLLPGSSHCDFEGPTNRFCRAVCGDSPPGMQALAREEAVNAAVEMLRLPRDERATGPAGSPH